MSQPNLSSCGFPKNKKTALHSRAVFYTIRKAGGASTKSPAAGFDHEADIKSSRGAEAR